MKKANDLKFATLVSAARKLENNHEHELVFDLLSLASELNPEHPYIIKKKESYKKTLGYYALTRREKLDVNNLITNYLSLQCHDKNIKLFGIIYNNSDFDKYLDKPNIKHDVVYTEGEIFRLDLPYKEYYNNSSLLTREGTGKKLYLIGSSSPFQPFISYEDTIEYNIFQNTNLSHCESIGYPSDLGYAFSLLKIIKKINSGEINSGDYVFIINDLHTNLQKVKNTHDVYLDTFDCYYDRGHFSSKGASIISNKILNIINDEVVIEKELEINLDLIQRYEQVSKYVLRYLNYKSQDIDNSFHDFKKYLIEHKDNNSKKCSSILVNCNPITLGHQYLINTACENSDRLYLFVIESESSEYSFKDRFNMVENNYRNNKKVTVLRGGKFMCTEHIIPEYFNKDSITDEDLENIDGMKLETFYFGRKIAPLLNITDIWLGSEPNCKLTSKYNEFMSKSMPYYGVNVNIIPRVNKGGAPISASRVRKDIINGNFDGIKDIVSDVTLSYLKNIHYPIVINSRDNFKNIFMELKLDDGDLYNRLSSFDHVKDEPKTYFLHIKYLDFFNELISMLDYNGILVPEFLNDIKSQFQKLLDYERCNNKELY